MSGTHAYPALQMHLCAGQIAHKLRMHVCAAKGQLHLHTYNTSVYNIKLPDPMSALSLCMHMNTVKEQGNTRADAPTADAAGQEW